MDFKERRKLLDETVEKVYGEESEQHKNTIRVLLATMLVGPNADKIAKFLDLNRDNFVRPRVKRLRQNGILQGREILCDWDDERTGNMSVLLDALVAEGLIIRSGGEPGDWRYDKAEATPESGPKPSAAACREPT
jgi:hypothetical protein